MKATTAAILSILNETEFETNLVKMMDENPTVVHGDVQMNESKVTYLSLKDLLIQSIGNESFDLIPFNRRNAILSVLDAIKSNLGNPPNIIAQIEMLQDHINISGLYYMNVGNRNIKKQLDDLTKIKTRYNKYLKDFDETKNTLQFISKKRTELDKLVENTRTQAEDIDKIQTKAGVSFQGIEESVKQVDYRKQVVDQRAQEVEDKKVGVVTFSNNIETYKTTIDELVQKCEAIVAKQDDIDHIIKDAEKALQLNSTLGVSAAFTAKYDEASNKYVYGAWLGGAFLLMLIALTGTVWIISGWKVPDPTSIASIIGRVGAVGLTVTAATFCANQYVKQKYLAEDYAYKSTLAKSIIAFKDEIAKNDNADGTKLASYLTKVLEEIHQDPLRQRGKESKSDNLNLDAIKKVAEILKLTNLNK